MARQDYFMAKHNYKPKYLGNIGVFTNILCQDRGRGRGCIHSGARVAGFCLAGAGGEYSNVMGRGCQHSGRGGKKLGMFCKTILLMLVILLE